VVITNEYDPIDVMKPPADYKYSPAAYTMGVLLDKGLTGKMDYKPSSAEITGESKFGELLLKPQIHRPRFGSRIVFKY